MYVNVAVAAIAAAGIVVGLTLDTRTAPAQPHALPGKPPVPVNVPACRCDRRSWPRSRAGRKGSIDAMQRLGLEHLGGDTPKERYVSAVVQYFRGVALDWAGYPIDGSAALDRAKTLGKNTMIHNQADALNHRASCRPARRSTRSSSPRRRTRCSSRAPGFRSRATRSRPSTCTRRRRSFIRRTSRLRSPRRSGSSTKTTCSRRSRGSARS